MPRNQFLTGKELLDQINKSKVSYGWFEKNETEAYHTITNDPAKITEELIQNTRKSLKLSDEIEIIIRVMCADHIPINRKESEKNASKAHFGLPFPPYKHFALRDGQLTEVGRSHWRGSLSNGSFCEDHGQITNDLAKMILEMVRRYSMKANWRGYSYVDEMRDNAILQLIQVALKFDESRSVNIFAYYTQIISNVFIRTLNAEKHVQYIYDELRVDAGEEPSLAWTMNAEKKAEAGEPLYVQKQKKPPKPTQRKYIRKKQRIILTDNHPT